MRKMILPLAILGAAGLAAATDFEVHGDVNLDFGSYFNKNFDPKNVGSQDIDLSLKILLDENVSVVVKTNTNSTFGDAKEAAEVRHGYAHATAMGDPDNRFTGFDFDGAQLRWDVSHDVSLVFGDMTYSAGAFNHYFWRDASKYAVVVREQQVRGIGAEFGNAKYGYGNAYLGVSDQTNHTVQVFATYSYPVVNKPDEHLIVTPSVDWVFGENIGRPNGYVFGVEADYAKSYETMEWGIHAVWGTHPYKEKGTHAFLLEPSMKYDFFNLAATFYTAIVNSNYEAEPQLFTEDQLMFAIEPSFNLHKKFSMGVAYEYHNKDTEKDDDQFHYLGGNFYLYPTLKTEVVFWAGYNFHGDNKKSPFGSKRFALGMSASASF